MDQKIVALVPARSGSLGLSDKNIKDLNGKPLVAHSIEPAVMCTRIEETYLSSDSQEYLEIGKTYGAVAFERPVEFAQSHTSMLEVVKNFVQKQEAIGDNYDAVVVLYPTYPFRTPGHLEAMIDFFLSEENCCSIIGLKDPDTHPFLCMKQTPGNALEQYVEYDMNEYYRRQDYPECYELTAWAMIISTHHLDELNTQMIGPSTRGYKIPPDVKIVDIDTALDFEFAEFLLSRK
jgi:CMP-N-acetylneuraminic acid synthetase